MSRSASAPDLDDALTFERERFGDGAGHRQQCGRQVVAARKFLNGLDVAHDGADAEADHFARLVEARHGAVAVGAHRDAVDGHAVFDGHVIGVGRAAHVVAAAVVMSIQPPCFAKPIARSKTAG